MNSVSGYDPGGLARSTKPSHHERSITAKQMMQDGVYNACLWMSEKDINDFLMSVVLKLVSLRFK